MSAVAEQVTSTIAESNTVSMFERLARDPSVDVVKLEKLVELQERADARNAKAVFAAAFAQMQGEIPVIAKNGAITVNNEVRSRFARLEDIDAVVKPILQRHGFAITHKTRFGEKGVTVVSVLMHSGGHTEETEFVSGSDTSGGKNAIQGLSSTTSYGKRQNIKALLNIAEGGEDDDGNGAGTAKVDDEQAATLQALIDDVKPDVPAFFKYLSGVCKVQIAKIEDIPAKAYPDAVGLLNRKRRAKKKEGK